jgi:aminobenzoyl-glutamate utilization protein B
VEFDALPDLGNEPLPNKTPRKDGVTNGHGCGHNLIGSGAIGAAIALKTHLEKSRSPERSRCSDARQRNCWPA